MPTGNVIQQLRRAALLVDGEQLTDAQLVGCFVERRDEAAMALLVRRHGPMVLGVCRRVLRNYHDAEDAFQAAFLVLARKAGSLRSPEALANWLYGVAYNVAHKSRATSARRRAREKQADELPEPAVVAGEGGREELRERLDRELNRLPDKYRAPVVLCHLEGISRKEAACRLGLSEGTVSSRLARAKVLLARRLRRRGLDLSGGLAPGLLGGVYAPANMPAALAPPTAAAACSFATGRPGGGVPVRAAALAEGVMGMMSSIKLTAGLVLLFVAAAAGVGGTAPGGQTRVARQAGRKEPPPPEARANDTDRQQKEAQEKQQKAVKEELARLQGTWVLSGLEFAGEAFAPQDVTTDARTLLTITGDKCEQGQALQKNKGEYSLRIDPTTKPKSFDTTGGAGVKSTHGIYQLEGDTLKMMNGGEKPGDRPKEMKATTAPQSEPARRGEKFIVVWKRVQP
jgi:RNA polymerase sigma factor (sigma-70 family)